MGLDSRVVSLPSIGRGTTYSLLYMMFKVVFLLIVST